VSGSGGRGAVAFQGEPGAYSQMAIFSIAGPDAPTLACRTFRDAFEAVRGGAAETALVPIENSTAGSVVDTYDLLHSYDLPIVGECYLRVVHCLLARKPVDPASLRVIHSHPQALAQCEAFLSGLPAEKRAVYDTAGSAKTIARGGADDEGAVASALAARLYGLTILREGIESDRANTTRFVRIAREPVVPESPTKTSLSLTLPHRPGALHGALLPFARRGVNLTQLESRPWAGRPFEYVFHVDLEGSASDPPVREAIEELSRLATSVRVLGSYRAASRDAFPGRS